MNAVGSLKRSLDIYSNATPKHWNDFGESARHKKTSAPSAHEQIFFFRQKTDV